MSDTQEIREQDIQHLSFFKPLMKVLDRLHDCGTERDRAGNRELHFDQYCCLVLLYLFNPIVSSLRAIQQASELKKVQRILKCKRASLGSLSESVAVFDPGLLQEIVQELYQQLAPVENDAAVSKAIKQLVTLVDGTRIEAMARVTQAMWLSKNGDEHHSWHLHTQFELSKYVPTQMTLTVGSSAGDASEREVLKANLAPDRCYVGDRGYANFLLFNKINSIDSSYVVRVRDNSVYEVLEDRLLSDEACQANVIGDYIVKMGEGSKKQNRPNHPIRMILIKVKPHDKRSNRKGNTGAGPSDGVLRVVTNLLDVPAEIIGLLYEYRYAIELYFRFFKHILGCRHLLSEKPEGIAIQTYMAIIACMLISLYTGRKPTLRTYEMICYYLTGMADLDEFEAHLKKLKPHNA